MDRGAEGQRKYTSNLHHTSIPEDVSERLRVAQEMHGGQRSDGADGKRDAWTYELQCKCQLSRCFLLKMQK